MGGGSSNVQSDESKKERNKLQGQMQEQKMTQQQLVDQNYANNILFMALSTMESLQHRLDQKQTPMNHNTNKVGLRSEDKFFGVYDEYDYCNKSIEELKDQLNNNVFLLANSRMAFVSQYRPQSYKLPKNYNQQKVLQRIQSFKARFYQLKDQQSWDLADDMELILKNGEYNNLKCLKMPFIVQQKNNNMNNFMYNAMSSTNRMHDQGDRIRKTIDPNTTKPQDLPFKQNSKYKNNQINNQFQNNTNTNNNINNNNNMYNNINSNPIKIIINSNHPYNQQIQNIFRNHRNNIKQLAIQNCQISQQLYEQVMKLSNLQALKLISTPLQSQDLIKALQNNRNISTLQLNNCEVNDAKLKQIAAYLPAKLKYLNINNNDITIQGIYWMYKQVQKDSRQLNLQQLHIANHRLDQAKQNKFENICTRCPNVRVLDISKNAHISDNQAYHIGKYMTKLQRISLGRTNINSNGLDAIGKVCKQLRILDITGNYYSIATVSQILKILPNLRQLHITIQQTNYQQSINCLNQIRNIYKNCKITYYH